MANALPTNFPQRTQAVLTAVRGAWIPPAALVAGQLAHGASWIVLFALACRGLTGSSPQGLAWVHLVALGWLTTVSLAVLMHVIPGFMDLKWRGERLARRAIAPFWIATLVMAVGFWRADFTLVAGAAIVVATSLAVYLACAAATLRRFRAAPDNSPRVLQAFALVFLALGLTATLGLGLAFALNGDLSPRWLIGIPALHAHIGAIGWLTLLVVGVAARTVRRITGIAPDGPWLHVVAATLLLAALFPLGYGITNHGSAWILLAGGLGLAGASVHAWELVSRVRRADEPHRPPQAFIGAAAGYLWVAAGLGLGVALGRGDWGPAYVFLGLAGWLGQMVNGHLHHIGVRLLATLARGDDDDTSPEVLLVARLSWAAFGASQLAVVFGTLALLSGSSFSLGLAATFGLAGWGCMVANARQAWLTAREYRQTS